MRAIWAIAGAALAAVGGGHAHAQGAESGQQPQAAACGFVENAAVAQQGVNALSETLAYRAGRREEWRETARPNFTEAGWRDWSEAVDSSGNHDLFDELELTAKIVDVEGASVARPAAGEGCRFGLEFDLVYRIEGESGSVDRDLVARATVVNAKSGDDAFSPLIDRLVVRSADLSGDSSPESGAGPNSDGSTDGGDTPQSGSGPDLPSGSG